MANGDPTERWLSNVVIFLARAIGFAIGEILRRTFFGILALIGMYRDRPKEHTVPLETRFEHTLVVGGSGHGKTQLLQVSILNDLIRFRGAKAEAKQQTAYRPASKTLGVIVVIIY